MSQLHDEFDLSILAVQ